MQAFFYICEYLDVTPQEFFNERNAHPETLQAFIVEAKRLAASFCIVPSDIQDMSCSYTGDNPRNIQGI